MEIKILKTESERRIIEINGERVGSVVPPDNYRVIYSISTMGTIQFIMIPDDLALKTANKINIQLSEAPIGGDGL